MKITVETPTDWIAVTNVRGPVVDPMILRCGELFMRGSVGAVDAPAAWDLLTRNIHALGTFFDHLILDSQIPVFNYADTFDLNQNFNTRALAQVNTNEEILVDVDVRYAEYQRVKTAVLEDLKKLYDGREARVDPQDAYNILGELTASGYAWYPDLGDLNVSDEGERRLAAFILGGLIFGGYAQLAGANHLMQPKRSRLFLAISLKQRASRTAEEYLFSKLGELVGRPTVEIPYTPTFFPLLLQKSDGPAALLSNALELRKSAEVQDYRSWLTAALTDFDRNGRISIELVREIEKIADAIRGKLQGFPWPTVEIKTSITDVVALRPPVPELNLTEPVKAAWGWVVEQLPQNRHRKLLTRAIIADREYVELDRRVQTVWTGTGVPG